MKIRFLLLQVYLGEQYVNNATLSDVTFLVGGCKSLFLHWIYFTFVNPDTFISVLAQILFTIICLFECSVDFKFSPSGKRFYAHRICLLASSDAFRAMFDGGYRVSTHILLYFLMIFVIYVLHFSFLLLLFRLGIFINSHILGEFLYSVFPWRYLAFMIDIFFSSSFALLDWESLLTESLLTGSFEFWLYKHV